MSGWCHMIFFSFVMGTASVISANSLNWHMLWSTRVYYWEQTTWRSTLEQRKFCDVAVAQSLQTEEAGLVQPGVPDGFLHLGTMCQVALGKYFENCMRFQNIPGRWLDKPFVYQHLSRANFNQSYGRRVLRPAAPSRAKKSKNVLSVPLLALPLMKYTLQFWYTCNWCYIGD